TFEVNSVSALRADGETSLTLTTEQREAIEEAFSILPDGVSGGNTNEGTVSWDYSIAEAEVDFLAAGEVATAVFTITVTDDEGNTDTQDITVTITGSNDSPFITAGDVSETMQETEGTLQTSGSFDVLDVDITDAVTVTDISVSTSDTAAHAPSEAMLLAMLPQPAIDDQIIDDASTEGTVNWSFNSGLDQFDYLAV